MTLTVSVNSSIVAARLPTRGNIRITPTGGTAVNIPVSLTVIAPPAVSATPTSLTFNYRAGDSSPASQPLTVSGGSGLGLHRHGIAVPATGCWFRPPPVPRPATVNVSINTTGLTTGNYIGTVLVAGTCGAPGSTTVNVTLNVTAPLPTITKVTNAASYATAAISPGEIITLFASDPSHPIGPGDPGRPDARFTGKVSTSIGGVQVRSTGMLAP